MPAGYVSKSGPKIYHDLERLIQDDIDEEYGMWRRFEPRAPPQHTVIIPAVRLPQAFSFTLLKAIFVGRGGYQIKQFNAKYRSTVVLNTKNTSQMLIIVRSESAEWLRVAVKQLNLVVTTILRKAEAGMFAPRPLGQRRRPQFFARR